VTFGKPATEVKTAEEMLEESARKKAMIARGEQVPLESLDEAPKPFQIIKISVLREYLAKEFGSGEISFDSDFILTFYFTGHGRNGKRWF